MRSKYLANMRLLQGVPLHFHDFFFNYKFSRQIEAVKSQITVTF